MDHLLFATGIGPLPDTGLVRFLPGDWGDSRPATIEVSPGIFMGAVFGAVFGGAFGIGAAYVVPWTSEGHAAHVARRMVTGATDSTTLTESP